MHRGEVCESDINRTLQFLFKHAKRRGEKDYFLDLQAQEHCAQAELSRIYGKAYHLFVWHPLTEYSLCFYMTYITLHIFWRVEEQK